MLTFGSLFTGFGGMDLGLEQAGLTCLWQCENNPSACRVLERHWPGKPRYQDVADITETNRPQEADLLVGGDPCQGNSGAGPGTGASLGGEFLRVVALLRPIGVLRENPTHTRRDAPWPWWRFRSCLESLGYVVLPFRLRACCVGAIHQRDRLFLFGVDPDAYRHRLEGRKDVPTKRRNTESPRLVSAEDWKSLLETGTFGSRAGLPEYVEQIRGLGNAVHVAQAYQIGQWLLGSATE